MIWLFGILAWIIFGMSIMVLALALSKDVTIGDLPAIFAWGLVWPVTLLLLGWYELKMRGVFRKILLRRIGSK